MLPDPLRERRLISVACGPALLAFATMLSLGTTPAIGQDGRLGQFEGHGDVGAPKLAGSADYNAVSQEYSLSASGLNMWASRDEFQFVWKKMKGDFILQARVELLGQGVDPHRKLGFIARTSLDPDSPYVDAAIHGEGLTSLQFRRTKGAITEQVQSTQKAPDFVQLERKGNTYTMSVARFGDALTPSLITDLPLGDELYVGLFLCSHNPAVVERAVFRDVRIIRPAKDGFVPYRDYIGSVLEVLDVASGRRQVLLRSAQPFEAPNWTRDGDALIYNTSGRDPAHRGRLHRFDLATRQATVIDTGSAIRNNNDHVLSFDGTTLGISDQSMNDGKSTVFTLPATGGTPKRASPLGVGPSYFHSWSPDGRSLVYTGGRELAGAPSGSPLEFDIYKIAADGSGAETNLTNSKGLDDGPEYTPDGKYIYFNSTRSGSMQLFRMKPDGKDQEQVTDDEFNNWFPHISPDGQWIAFVSFGKDVDPADHPYYRRVTLRLMPITGGPAKVIAYVYGGQGTMNVPSWSPDGRMLAFVSNTDADQ